MAGTLQSPNYIAGQAGWKLDADTGEIEAQDIIARGIFKTAVNGARIELDSVNYLRAYDANNLRAKLDTTKLNFWDSNGVDKGYLRGDQYWLEITAKAALLLKAGTGYTLNLRCGNTSPITMTATAIDIGVNMAPHDSTTNLGSATWKWNYIYRTNESACEMPTNNSALDIIKKIKKPKVKKGEYGKRHYFEDKDFPKEMKCTHKGKTEIEFTRTIGVLVQSVRELTAKVEKLETPA